VAEGVATVPAAERLTRGQHGSPPMGGAGPGRPDACAPASVWCWEQTAAGAKPRKWHLSVDHHQMPAPPVEAEPGHDRGVHRHDPDVGPPGRRGSIGHKHAASPFTPARVRSPQGVVAERETVPSAGSGRAVALAEEGQLENAQLAIPRTREPRRGRFRAARLHCARCTSIGRPLGGVDREGRGRGADL